MSKEVISCATHEFKYRIIRKKEIQLFCLIDNHVLWSNNIIILNIRFHLFKALENIVTHESICYQRSQWLHTNPYLVREFVLVLLYVILCFYWWLIYVQDLIYIDLLVYIIVGFVEYCFLVISIFLYPICNNNEPNTFLMATMLIWLTSHLIPNMNKNVHSKISIY